MRFSRLVKRDRTVVRFTCARCPKMFTCECTCMNCTTLDGKFNHCGHHPTGCHKPKRKWQTP